MSEKETIQDENEEIIEEEQQIELEDVIEDQETPEYEPDYTYKVKDEVREFDERFRDLVKDKDSEDYLRELYTKSDGLDSYKEKTAKLEDSYKQVYEQATQLTTGYQTLQQLRDSKAFNKLQEALGLDDEFVTDWGLSLVKQSQLPPEQKELLQKNRELENKLTSYETNNKSYQEQLDSVQVKRDIGELKSYATSAEYKPLVEAMGKNGIQFLDEVLAVGSLYYQTHSVEPTIKEAVDMVANKFKFITQTDKPPIGEQQPTIPNVRGNNKNTVKSTITSLDDIKALAAQIDS